VEPHPPRLLCPAPAAPVAGGVPGRPVTVHPIVHGTVRWTPGLDDRRLAAPASVALPGVSLPLRRCGTRCATDLAASRQSARAPRRRPACACDRRAPCAAVPRAPGH